MGKVIKLSSIEPYVFCLLVFALCLMFSVVSSEARVTGSCSNCHTMHNSQGGKSVAKDFDGFSFSTTDTPKKNLLIYSCLGCHSATDGNKWQDSITKAPIVFNTNEPNYNTEKGLAGGNFHWVISNETRGHNILTQDTQYTDPSKVPGCDITRINCGTNSCHANLYGIVSGTGDPNLDGRQGCEKCHLAPKHHAYDHAYLVGGLVTSAEQGWYRFLSGHTETGEGHGVEGYEDGDWQYTVSSSDHNEYLGKQFPGFSGFVLGNTTTAFCTGCHGKFHTDQGTASPWLRHPSDAVLPASGEYSNYKIYNPLAPVARSSLQSSPDENVSSGDMVMCLSCHRAHASPYFKMMRWDYKNSNLSTALEGCNVCHSSKN